MKRLMRILLILFLLVGLGAGGFWFYQQRTQAQADTSATEFSQVITVERGNIAATITVVGELVAVQHEDLTFERLEGVTELLSLDVTAGNFVEAGQQIATIDPAPYEQALDEAKATLQEAAQALADLRTPATELEQAQAQLAVTQAELDLKQTLKSWTDLNTASDLTDLQVALQNARDALALAQLRQSLVDHNNSAQTVRNLGYAIEWNQRRYWELKDLIGRGEANLEQMEELEEVELKLGELQADLAHVQSQSQISGQAAAAEVANAQAAVAQAQEDLARVQRGSDALDLAEAQVAVQQAAVRAQEMWQARADLETGPDEAALAAAQRAVERAQQSVADAEADLAAAILRAPFAGTILQTNATAGNRITSNSIILTLANLDELQVVAAVDETTIRQVAQGQAVQVTFDAFPDQSFQGEVLAVPLQGELQGDVMVYEVPISLPGSEDLPLLVGMTANAEIQVGQAEDVLLVPSMAIQGARGRQMVLVPGVSDPTADTPAAPVPVEVEVGLSDGIRTEIVSGLNEGDPVLVQMSTGDNGFGFGGGGFLLGGPGGGNRGPRN